MSEDEFKKFQEQFDRISRLFETNRAFKEAVDNVANIMKNSGFTQYSDLFGQSSIMKLTEANAAAQNEIFKDDADFNNAMRSLESIKNSLGLSGIDWLTSPDLLKEFSLGESFGSKELAKIESQIRCLVNPSVYVPVPRGMMAGLTSMEQAMSALPKIDTVGLANAMKPLAEASKVLSAMVDTSWMDAVSNWQRSVAQIAKLDISGLTAGTSTLSRLLKIEQETAGILSTRDGLLKLTSTASQVASLIESSASMYETYRELAIPRTLIDSYSDFAIKQHKKIQKAEASGDTKSVKWRLGILDSAAQYVDRQVTWANDLLIDVQEDIEADAAESELTKPTTEIVLPPVGQYLGYSRRQDKPVEDAFKEAVFTRISEKGKNIINNARIIKKRCLEMHQESPFNDFENSLQACMTISAFTYNAEGLLLVLGALVDIFVSNKDIIYKYIDNKKFDCLERIENLWNEKKLPEKEADITKLQESLYDDILNLEVDIILKIDDLPQEVDNNKGSESVSQGKFEEHEVSDSICRALINIGKNSLYHNRGENVLNDGLRDLLSMNYREIKDQTRQGESENGTEAGEIDLQLCNDGNPMVMIEALRLDSVARAYIKSHIDKVLTKYDPLGCPFAYVVMYVDIERFDQFWNRFSKYIIEEYQFPYRVIRMFKELACLYTAMRHGRVILERDGRNVSVHFFALKIKWKKQEGKR